MNALFHETNWVQIWGMSVSVWTAGNCWLWWHYFPNWIFYRSSRVNMSTSTSGLDFSWFDSEPMCCLCGSLDRIPASNDLTREVDVLNKKLTEINRLRIESVKLKDRLSKPSKNVDTSDYRAQINALKLKIKESSLILSRGAVLLHSETSALIK